MVVSSHREIGSWFWYFGYSAFGVDTRFVFDKNDPASQVFMSKVLDIIKVLKKHQLMVEVKGDHNMSLRVNSLESFIQDYYQYVSFSISGQGVIITTNQEEVTYGNLVSIFIDRLPLSLSIEIHSPVFLPISLDGYPQKALYDYNSPRLEKALQEIEQLLGMKPSQDDNESSDYCIMKGYHLINFIEDDGVIFGLRESGHVLFEDERPKVPFDPEYLKSLI